MESVLKCACMKKIKAVFLDMDGTLYSHHSGGIPSSALQAVQAARDNGVLVFVATGRHFQELQELHVTDFPCDGWITVNGACCYNDAGIYHSDPIDAADVRIVVEAQKETPFTCIFCEEKTMFINRYDEDVRRSLQKIHSDLPQIAPAARAMDHEIYQIIPYAREEVWNPLAAKMKHIKYLRWTELALDVNADTAGKYRGVIKTCEHYHLDPLETAAFGDGINDLELFEACGFSVCMGNGRPELREKADHVCADIDDDGLYKAFRFCGII